MAWQDAESAVSGGNNVEPNGDFFVAVSSSLITIGTDANNPDYITGLVIAKERGGFTIDANGAVTNNSGRTIGAVTGTISFQPDKSGGGTTQLQLWSEISPDGVTWTQNQGSLRTIEISNNGETFKTSISLAFNWPSGSTIRFRLYTSGGGSINFVPPTDTVLGGEVITGASAIWELKEM